MAKQIQMNKSDMSARSSPFTKARWIWAPATGNSQYVLFVRTVHLPRQSAAPVCLRISASYHYELFINGVFIGRGPVHGDAHWCQYDEWIYPRAPHEDSLQIAVVVNHYADVYVHYLFPAPAGLIAEIECAEMMVGTDQSWQAVQLPMWDARGVKRGWALGYYEDYNAALEPVGWQEKRFETDLAEGWQPALLVPHADEIWTDYQRRMTPPLQREWVNPLRFKAFRALGPGAPDMGGVSFRCDEETLYSVQAMAPYSPDAVNALMGRANAFTFDLGREQIGFYALEIEAPAGMVIDISGAELLRDGRPWIFRKSTGYSARYRTGGGRRTFVSFAWSGFRYLHLVIRGGSSGVRLHRVGCLSRRGPLTVRGQCRTDDPELRRIFDLCRYTLAVGVQEHIIDCPTREQTQYWGDAVFIANNLWCGFGEAAYLRWYLECFLRVPFQPSGQIFAGYPGLNASLVDFALMPLLGQRFYFEHMGTYYRPAETLAKALQLKSWYDRHGNADGLVEFDYEAYFKKGLINFIDHPGIGWHNFNHPGIDRHGASCPLNILFFMFVRILGDMARALQPALADELGRQADNLCQAIRRVFFDGQIFHDAVDKSKLSAGTSWQTNGLAVYSGISAGPEAQTCLRAMLAGYDRLCRCSPYFHFIFLPALRQSGLEQEALDLIKREWNQMLAGDATTTWESFLGDYHDSLCHPFSTAPFLFLLENVEASNRPNKIP